eukprot:369590-Hanusia_phi.AAC.1
MAQEINRLEDLNFLAETSLLKYTSELEDARRMLDEAVARVVELEDILKKYEVRQDFLCILWLRCAHCEHFEHCLHLKPAPHDFNKQEHIVSLNQELTEVVSSQTRLFARQHVLGLCQEEIATEIDKHLADLQEAAVKHVSVFRWDVSPVNGLHVEMSVLLEEVQSIREDARNNSLYTQVHGRESRWSLLTCVQQTAGDVEKTAFFYTLHAMMDAYESGLELLQSNIVRSRDFCERNKIVEVGRLSWFESIEPKLSEVLGKLARGKTPHQTTDNVVKSSCSQCMLILCSSWFQAKVFAISAH